MENLLEGDYRNGTGQHQTRDYPDLPKSEGHTLAQLIWTVERVLNEYARCITVKIQRPGKRKLRRRGFSLRFEPPLQTRPLQISDFAGCRPPSGLLKEPGRCRITEHRLLRCGGRKRVLSDGYRRS